MSWLSRNLAKLGVNDWMTENIPSVDSADNDHVADVIGNKSDTSSGNSLYSSGKRLENGLLAGAHFEKVYPYDIAGVTVTPGNGAWGATIVIIPIDGVTDDYGWNSGDVTAYEITGFEYMLSAGASKPNTIQYLRIVKSTAQILDGDANGGQAIIPVPLTGDFEVDDYIWIVDDDTAGGELCKIGSISEDNTITVTVNLTGTYTVAQNAVVYLARRKGDTGFRAVWDKFAHADTKSVIRHTLHAYRSMAAGDGVIARAYGIDDATGIMLITVIFD